MSDSLARARIQLRRVLESPESDFYRRKYEGHARAGAAAAGADWGKVPFLTRDEIQRAPLWNRICSARTDVAAIRPTSGTSGKGLMLMPRSDYGAIPDRWQHPFLDDIPRNRLASFSGGLFFSHFGRSARVDTLQLVPGESAISAALVTKYRPGALAGFPYALTALAPLLSDEVRSSIAYVQVWGEFCTELEWSYLKKHFSHALFFLEYSSIETQTSVAATCLHAARSGERHMHPIEEFAYTELVNERGEIITEPNISGELIITTVRPVLFPLIRYRSGDTARIISASCGCGSTVPLLQIEGRIEIDRLRIRGGEINLAEADRALAALSRYLTGHSFEIRFSEVSEAGALKPRITVACSFSNDTEPEELAKRIASALRVAPDTTYMQGVMRGDYAPLSVVNRADAEAGGKRVRIVRE